MGPYRFRGFFCPLGPERSARVANEAHVVHDSRFPPALLSHLTPWFGHAGAERRGEGGDTESDKIQQLALDCWRFSLFSLLRVAFLLHRSASYRGYVDFDNRSSEIFVTSFIGRPLILLPNFVKN